jgi:hypothetical protein
MKNFVVKSWYLFAAALVLFVLARITTQQGDGLMFGGGGPSFAFLIASVICIFLGVIVWIAGLFAKK